MSRWMGPARLLWRTRHARRAGDWGAAVQAVARGADTAVGLRVRGRHTVLLLDPAAADELLTASAKATTKGPGLQLTRPLLGNGLLTSEGDDHARARRLIAPVFSPRRLAGYVDTFATCSSAQFDGWRDGDEVDAHHEMATLALTIVGQTLLGLDLSSSAPAVRAGLESALDQFNSNSGPGVTGRARRRGPALPQSDPAAIAPVHELVDQIIEQRRATAAEDRGDVVSALVAAEASGLTPAEVHDNVITLLMAGHETTANALSFTLYLLGTHPEVQRRLQAEVTAILAGRPPAFADLPSLTYTRAVLSEAMRLYPPAWIIGRTVESELDLGGYHLPAGSVAAISPLLLHRDRRWFPQPETFDPDRWLDVRRDAVPRHAYLPFGTGPRSCIGEQFAWAEATTVLATLAQRWTVVADAARPPAVEYRVTMRPAAPIPITVRSLRA